MSSAIRPEVRLVTEIADQFRHKPVDKAADAIANHVRMFWDPRMRTALLAAEKDGEVSDPLVTAAIAQLQT